jgi:hypothetical protein
LELKNAFESLAQQDLQYTFEPSLQEWEKAQMIRENWSHSIERSPNLKNTIKSAPHRKIALEGCNVT